jgi:hypothetical protein
MSLAALLALPAIGCAQEPKQNAGAGRGANADQRQWSNAQDPHEGERGAQPGGKAPRRLESVTWNSVKHQLTWVISKGGGAESGKPDPAEKGQDRYEINMDNATMVYNGEVRRFSKEEASNVHMLMDLISKYAVDSTIWWDQGQGQKLDRDGRPVDGDGDKDEGKKSKVLRVSGPSRDLTVREVDSEIQRLEQQLEALKARRRMDGASLKTTSH